MNAAVLLVLLIIFRPEYDTNDDFGLCNIVNGSKGSFDAHIVYSNYLLGLIYVGLYKITCAVPWYPVIHYAVLFSSYTAMSYVLINKLKHSSAVWIVAAIMPFVAYEGYIAMQFTRTAGFATAGGLMLMFWAFCRDNESGRWKLAQIVAGIVIAIFGFMYRESQFLAVAGIMSAIGIMVLLGRPKRIIALICAFLVLFGTVGLLMVFDKKAYTSDEWQDYREYNRARSQLYDHGFPEYEQYQEGYEKLGINANAKNFYRQWNHVDLDGKTMLEISCWNKEDEREINSDYVKDFIRTMTKGYMAKPIFYVFLATVIMWLFFGKKNWISIVGIAYAAVVAAGLNWYMFSMARFLKDRVDVGIIVAAMLVVLWTFKNTKPLFNNIVGMIGVIISFVLLQYAWSDSYRWNQDGKDISIADNRMVAEEIAQDKEHLYLNKAVGFSYSDAYDVFDRIPQGVSENVFTLGGWTCGMPANREKLEKFGISNVYEDSIGNDNVYIIDKDINTTIKYINDYYNSDARAEYVRNIGSYPIYRLVK